MTESSFLIVGAAREGLFPPEKLAMLAQDRKVIVLDGAAHQVGIPFDLVLGDLDSLPEAIQKHLPPEKILKIDSQDTTDLEKGILYCDQNKAASITIVHALDTGRMDHTWANVNFLAKYHRRDRRIRLLTPHGATEFLKDESLSLTGPRGSPVGIFGFPEATVTTTGLTWDLSEEILRIGGKLSCSNYLREETIGIQIQGQALVTYPVA